jgi:hypothetical protein
LASPSRRRRKRNAIDGSERMKSKGSSRPHSR